MKLRTHNKEFKMEFEFTDYDQKKWMAGSLVDLLEQQLHQMLQLNP